MLWNLTHRLRRFLRWLWLQKGTPGYKARGVAIGVFCGCFPLFGFQTVLGIALASVFRGNHLLAISATWISNPITYFPLYWLNYKVGAALLGHGENLQDPSLFNLREIWSQGWMFGTRLILGSSLVGIVLGGLTGLFIYFVFKSRS